MTTAVPRIIVGSCKFRSDKTFADFDGDQPPGVMRSALRLLAAVAAASTLASCVEMSSPSGARRSLSITPRFSQSATLAAATMAQAGVAYNSVHIVITRPGSNPLEILKDTTIVFGPASPEVTLELSIDAFPSEELEAGVEFKQDNTVIFSGKATVKAVSPAVAPIATPVIVDVDYTGPGFSVATVSITPGAGLFSASASTQFTATAFDGSNIQVLNVPIVWSVSDATKGTISSTGLLTPTGNRGSIDVTATAANGISKTVTVQLSPAASGLRVAQGAGQSGAPSSQLPVPVVVELVSADGLPAAGTGQSVTFSAGPGASITPTTTTLDANGRASATMTVGSTAGTTYIFTATSGAFSVQWGGTAKPGTPTHFVSNTSTTLTLTAGVTPNPVPTIRIADALENSVTGVILKVTLKEGGVTLAGSPFQVPADSVGLLEVYKVAPTKAGTYTILIETADPSLGVPSVTYNVTVNPAAAAKLAFTQQPPSSVTSGSPVTVKVAIQDQFGNTVTSATNTVSLSIEPGSSGYTVSGSAAAVAGVATISATATKTAGSVASAKLQATSGTLGVALSSAFGIP